MTSRLVDGLFQAGVELSVTVRGASSDGGSHESLVSTGCCRGAGLARCCRSPPAARHLLNWPCTPACSRNQFSPTGSLGRHSRRSAYRGSRGVEDRGSGLLEETTASRGKNRQQHVRSELRLPEPFLADFGKQRFWQLLRFVHRPVMAIPYE